jgi:uroporphyrinogen-III synthase/DNA-binding Lrp family transcriptional regulator
LKSESLPLKGKVVAVTRTPQQSREIIDLIKKYGGTPFLAPTLEIASSYEEEVKDFIYEIVANKFDYLIFLSSNSINSLIDEAEKEGILTSMLCSIKNIKVLCIGEKTKSTLQKHGVCNIDSAEKHNIEGIIDALPETLRGVRIGLPRSSLADETLSQLLQSRGAKVHEVRAYNTILPRDVSPVIALINKLDSGGVDAITFTSSSTALNLVAIAEEKGLETKLRRSMKKAIIVAMGPKTQSTIESLGFKVDVVPSDYSLKPMIDALSVRLRENASNGNNIFKVIESISSLKIILDDTDKKILSIIQDDFPIISRPWDSIAELLGLTLSELMKRVNRLHEEGVIRKIGPVLETDKVGLSARTLVLMKVPANRVEEMGKMISGFNEVTHNYIRDNEYNLWFTLITSSQEKLGTIFEEILKVTGIPKTDTLNLPVTRKHKIKVSYRIR